jgi:predicted MFS family arabinose efflux permease
MHTCRSAAGKWSYLLRLVGASMREGILDVGEFLKWMLPRVAGSTADASHASAAAMLPVLQASIWVRILLCGIRLCTLGPEGLC